MNIKYYRTENLFNDSEKEMLLGAYYKNFNCSEILVTPENGEPIKKLVVKISEGHKYVDDSWYELPRGRVVLDKGITGCGMTELALTCKNRNVIVLSPRLLLLENKAEQHKQDPNILYLDVTYEKDTVNLATGEVKKSKKNKITYEEFLSITRDRISNHIISCAQHKMCVKFLVTYDSAHYIIDFLREYNALGNYTFVVDEMQSLLTDAFFKPEIENELITQLSQPDISNVIYLSATPMMDEYLYQLDEFKEIRYYMELDWTESGFVSKVTVNKSQTTDLMREMRSIIEKYQKGIYPTYTDPNTGQVYISTEAVFYVNSVKQIVNTIKRMKLLPDQVNILISKTPENQKKLYTIGLRDENDKKYSYKFGTIPGKGEPHKMFTFCTSTVYVGADFYSTCASTFIFADSNISCLALDISTDLPQIVGRQRLVSNVFKNQVTLFFKVTRESGFASREDFDALQEERMKETKIMIRVWENLDEEARRVILSRYLVAIKYLQYEKDFLGYSKTTGKCVVNKLVRLADERAFELQQRLYSSTLMVVKTIEDLDIVEQVQNVDEELKSRLDQFLACFYSFGLFTDRLKYLCEFLDLFDDFPENKQRLISILSYRLPKDVYLSAYLALGTKGCSARKYREKDIRKLLYSSTKEVTVSLKTKVLETFEIGKKYTKEGIKKTLGDIYDSVGNKRRPKASDLLNYFELKDCLISNKETGKRDSGFEILGLKE